MLAGTAFASGWAPGDEVGDEAVRGAAAVACTATGLERCADTDADAVGGAGGSGSDFAT